MPEQAGDKRQNVKEDLEYWPPQLRELFELEDLHLIAEASSLQKVLAADYVNVLALNEAGEAMILEHGQNGGGYSSWRVIEGQVAQGEDPMTAVQRTLLEETGYQSDHWMYLCSYTITDDHQRLGVGHFFCARNARQLADHYCVDLAQDRKLKWVSQRDLKYALLDGRISTLSYAITISMALLTVLK
jgi:ADP-ribose pyrophosphatase YjhB (NUDIX family)